jgi:ubiquinone/menaquinone biosynthesis C-methylase UbiE
MTDIFNTEAERYDAWFDSSEGRVLFENEVAAIRLLWRDEFSPALEVGVGTGRFAQALKVEFGIDPAAGALRLAQGRGIKVKQARGEALPFPNAAFGGVLMIATLCFAGNPIGLLQEAARVLRPEGRLLIADIPRDSLWGKLYQRQKLEGHSFYRDAQFYAMDELENNVRKANLSVVGFASTLIESQPEAPRPEPARLGQIANSGFVCLLAQKG